MGRSRLYRRGATLAVMAEGGGFWLCRASKDVWLENEAFSASWLEQEQERDLYRRESHVSRIFLASVLSRVNLVREAGTPLLRLPEVERKRLELLLKSLAEGFTLQAYDKEHNQVRTTDILVMEREGEEEPAPRKRKIKDQGKRNSKVSKKKARLANGKAQKVKKKEKTRVKAKKVTIKKPPKEKVDKSNPNWRLKPNPNAPDWTSDPLFEGKELLPFVSSLSHSKLLHRAVLTKDLKLLQSCIKNTEEIHSLHCTRSLGNSMTALRYAVKEQNLAAIKLLTRPPGKSVNRCSAPRCLLPSQGTGTYNYRSLGIRKIRRLNMSRGSREGNNAFTKDQTTSHHELDLAGDMMSWNLPTKFITDMCILLGGTGTGSLFSLDHQEMVGSVIKGVRLGHRELAAHYIEWDLGRGGQSGFSKFYVQALLGQGNPWEEGGVREASAKKKAGWENQQVTPLHVACINPDPGPLAALWKVCSDLHLADAGGWKPVHYAAVCAGALPLQFLLERGASLGEPNKESLTPLQLACRAGREEVVEFIIKRQAQDIDPEDILKKPTSWLDQGGKTSWTALHYAVAEGRHGVVKLLLTAGANPNKQLNTTHDKMSSLMLAAANGDLEMVQVLVEQGKAKVELGDRYKRTALTHACINGSSAVSAYLVRLGANPEASDSSGNSCLHYACAYGWWFCMRALLESGAGLQPRNEWGLTPLGVAVMKGHKGIADHLASLPGIDIDMRDEKGRTLLASMLVDQQEGGFCLSLLDDIKVLVEKHGAKADLVDFQGRNALHHLTSSTFRDGLRPWIEDDKAQVKAMMLIASYLLEKGLSPWVADKEGDFPVSLVLAQRSLRCLGQRVANIELVQLLLRKMLETSLEQAQDGLELGLKRMLRTFSEHFSLVGLESNLETFTAMAEVTEKMLELGKVSEIDFLDTVDPTKTSKNGLTIFSNLCRSYISSSWALTDQEEELQGRKFADVEVDCWERGCSLLLTWITRWAPALHLDLPPVKEGLARRLFLPLLDMAKHSKDGHRAFRALLPVVPEVDVVDEMGKTPLLVAIDQQSEELVKLLLVRGAQVDRMRLEIIDRVEVREVPLQRAVQAGGQEVVRLLLQAGASPLTLPSTNVSVLHLAVKEAAKRRTKQSLAIVSLILDHGCNVNEVDKKGRTALHLAVNASTGDSEEGLELESLLLQRGALRTSLDCRGRTPLMYAFVKIGKHTDKSACDPIQVVSSLVDGMGLELLDHHDNFGHSALHYAGLRGSTVCALLMLQRGSSSLESQDSLGNTALSLAVLGRHEACAMMLLQREASIEATIREEETVPSKNKGLWRHLNEHWAKKAKAKRISLFEGIVGNDWLGLTYLVLAKMEQTGLTIAKALEVAIRLQKLQFAKTLLSRFIEAGKLKELVGEERTLLGCLAFHTSSRLDQRGEELLVDVFELLLKNGVEPFQVDQYNCLPLHYACLHHNRSLIRMLLELPEAESWLGTQDRHGRTPLASFFWSYLRLGEEGDPSLQLLLEKNSLVDVLHPSKPLSLLDCGYSPHHEDRGYLEPGLPGQIEVSLLMVAVVHRDIAMVRLLLKYGASPSLPDSRGWTAAMYALKTGSKVVVQELLPELQASSVQDADSLGLLHHAVALDPLELHMEGATTRDNTELMELMLKFGRPSPSTVSSLLQLAGRVGASRVGKLLAKRYGGKFSDTSMDHTMDDSRTLTQEEKFDYKNDSLKMMTSLEEELEKQKKKFNPATKVTQEGCTITDGHIWDDHDILLSKIDVGLGSWGLYNFYRLQIWKDANKELYVLFTNWGRIDRHSHGQFQNTPFSTAKEAMAEFSKIFLAKTGNHWEEKGQFVEKPRKYRMVAAELATKVIQPSVRIDLRTEKQSSLPFSLLRLLKEASDPAMLAAAYKKDASIDTQAVPFDRIKREVVMKAMEMLEQLEPLIQRREKLDSEKYEAEGEKQQKIFDELGVVLGSICSLSTEYYYLVPKPGFEFERLTPVDSSSELATEKCRLNLLLEFETAKALLLGAMLKKKEVSLYILVVYDVRSRL